MIPKAPPAMPAFYSVGLPRAERQSVWVLS
jgi:hypothetical protein